jgi:uncharacterized membrane protein YkvA (DUF1232 family)
MDTGNALSNAKGKALALVQDREKTMKLLDAAARLLSAGVKPLDAKGLTGRLKTMTRMVRLWMRREYRDVPWLTVVLITAGIIYFVSPADGIPDFIPLIGFTDDAAVISAVIASIGRDLERFLEWERSASTQEVSPSE